MAKATAVLARDVALEPALLPDRGRTQTKDAVMMGKDMFFRLGKKALFGRKNNLSE